MEENNGLHVAIGNKAAHQVKTFGLATDISAGGRRSVDNAPTPAAPTSPAGPPDQECGRRPILVRALGKE
jgi:hypothetical protein